ncbi:MAG: type IV pilin protein [bacterium]|nr:type IV pilin protein [bacterium]
MSTVKRHTGVKSAGGFSLIELLITVGVVSILATIVYPTYISSVYKARRLDAIASLSQTQIILERCYSLNFSYSAACASLPAFPLTSPQGFYRTTISNLTTSTYTLTAVPIGTQVNDNTCATMTLNQANVKTGADATGTTQTICWRQ